MVKKYYIEYWTGAGNKTVNGTLEDAMRVADEGLCYTQENVTIFDGDDRSNPVAIRFWCGCAYDPELCGEAEDEIVTFGPFGYYAAWQEL